MGGVKSKSRHFARVPGRQTALALILQHRQRAESSEFSAASRLNSPSSQVANIALRCFRPRTSGRRTFAAQRADSLAPLVRGVDGAARHPYLAKLSGSKREPQFDEFSPYSLFPP
jgi:hypothetical protein